MNERQRPWGRAVLAAVVLTVVVGILRAAITPWVGDRIPLGLFFAGPLVAAGIGGLWPGVLATVLGAATGDFFFMAPRGDLIPTDSNQWLGMVTFFVVGVAISAASEVLIRARERAEADRQALRENEAKLAKTLVQRDRAEEERRAHESRLEAQTDALRESDRRKDEYLAVLAHELRNPLAPIRNAAHFLSLLDPPDPEWKRPVEMIERQVAHMTRLIDDLLDVSRMATGVLQLRLQEVDLNEVVRTALDACRAEVDTRAHVVQLSLPSPSVRLRADRDRLIQVFCNLISNAAKYTGHEGTIDVDARAAGDLVEIAVRDNGRGIPAEQLARVFDLFVQVDRTLDGQGGLGIGLTLARQLVELHGGTIEARSEGVGCGSTFLVKLPIVPAARGSKPSRRAARAVEPRRVLLVDDSHDAAESLALLLETSGHETRVAFDGEAALQAAAEFQPEIAILDIGMPRLNGYELARRLRAQAWGRSIYLVALTGWGQESDQARAREAGFDAHLVKPAAFESIARVMERPRDAVR